MKKTILGFIAVMISSALLAQTPQLMSYQAVVRNGSNQLLANAPAGVRVSILQGSASGTAVYSETHTITTNAQGLANLSIGGGTAQSGTFAGINWGTGPYFLKTETDPTGGTNYSITATSQLMSVPYALFSSISETAINGVPAGGQTGEVLITCNGVPIWAKGGLCPAKISAIDCGTVTNNGTLISDVTADGVNSLITYSGGNGGVYFEQSVASSGVTGLSAKLSSGTLANGSGSLTLTISGKPSGNGAASFLISIGGQICTLTRNVITSPYSSGTVHCNGKQTEVVNVANPTTGKIWMDRNLGASQAATSINDAASYGDLYQWGRGADGHQCLNSANSSIISSTDKPTHGNFIIGASSPYDWRFPQNSDLWQGVSGINNPCPANYRIPTIAELNAERISWGSTLVGAFNSPLKLPIAGRRSWLYGTWNNDPPQGLYWSSSAQSDWAECLQIDHNGAVKGGTQKIMGCSVRCILETTDLAGSITNLDCGNSINYGILSEGSIASGIFCSVPYSGGNGGVYFEQSVASSGVTGLSAKLSSGTLANGSGSLNYTITGTPSGAGDANFILSICGRTCTLTRNVTASTYPTGTIECLGTATTVKNVINPATGKIWMDRNLGASRVATSINDADSYGDLYQWGRKSDGHQCRNSATSATLSSTEQPAQSNFIVAPNSPNDWLSHQNDNLWQGVSGVNNPCPSSYRIPTSAELAAELASWYIKGSQGAFNSPLKLPNPGFRVHSNGSLINVNDLGAYWSSSVSGKDVYCLNFTYYNANVSDGINRANGLSLRCIKD